MPEKPTTYIVYEDIPLEKFDNFVLPPMPATEIIRLLADESEGCLKPASKAEIRRVLIDKLSEGSKLPRSQFEQVTDFAIAEMREILRG